MNSQQKVNINMKWRTFMKRCVKRIASLGLCAVVATGLVVYGSDKVTPKTEVYAANEEVEVSDLVIKFLGVPEYEPNRYTKSGTGKWAPEELEKGLHLKADMVLGEGNPEGMMAPMKHSLADITAYLTFDQKTGKIEIKYNGLTMNMEAGSTTATVNNGSTTETLTMREEVTPYFKAVEGQLDENGDQYYACYVPVKFTAEALGGNVMWNDAMHRMEMAFAFYYSDAAVVPVINDKSNYTTKKMEGGGGVDYAGLVKRVTDADAAVAAKNIEELIKAGVTVVNPVYQNEDGGWGKTNTHYDLLDDKFVQLCNHAYSTFDNGSTHGHIKFLSKLLRVAKENPDLFTSYTAELDTIEKGFWKAVKYIIDAQTESGGWQQYWPYGVGYFANITFNDNAMPDVLDVCYALTNDSGLIDSTLCNDLAWAREAMANNSAYAAAAGVTSEKVQTAWDKGLAYTLEAQVEIGGVPAGWAQQYDAKSETPVPALGRAYELPSVSPNESNTVLATLANIKNPTDAVKNAITTYYAWSQEIGAVGYERKDVKDRTRELGKDRLVFRTGDESKVIFGRFYGLDLTGEYYGFTDLSGKMDDGKYYPIFSGRDGVAQLSQNYGMGERRSGYSFTNNSAASSAQKTYDKWTAAMGN